MNINPALDLADHKPQRIGQLSNNLKKLFKGRISGAAYSRVRGRTHALFQCQVCRHQTSLNAGTVMMGIKLPVTVWFLAIYLISQAKTGLSLLAFKRHHGVSLPTAGLIHHKLASAM